MAPLDGRGVSEEGCGHGHVLGRDVAHGRLDVVGDPLDEVAGHLGLVLQHLVLHLLHRHLSPELELRKVRITYLMIF